MSQILEEMRDESRNEGKREGKIEGKMEMIAKMLADPGFTAQKISEISGLSVEEIETLKSVFAN